MNDPAPSRHRTLEEKIAFLEKHVSDLDEVLRELFGRVETLEEDLRRTRSDLSRLQPDETTRTLEEERPPHHGG